MQGKMQEESSDLDERLKNGLRDDQDEGGPNRTPTGGMNSSLEGQRHFAQRRKGAEATKKAKELFISNLCALATLGEFV